MWDKILEHFASFSWTMETTLPSFMLFGEYPYPSESDSEEESRE